MVSIPSPPGFYVQDSSIFGQERVLVKSPRAQDDTMPPRIGRGGEVRQIGVSKNRLPSVCRQHSRFSRRSKKWTYNSILLPLVIHLQIPIRTRRQLATTNEMPMSHSANFGGLLVNIS